MLASPAFVPPKCHSRYRPGSLVHLAMFKRDDGLFNGGSQHEPAKIESSGTSLQRIAWQCFKTARGILLQAAIVSGGIPRNARHQELAASIWQRPIQTSELPHQILILMACTFAYHVRQRHKRLPHQQHRARRPLAASLTVMRKAIVALLSGSHKLWACSFSRLSCQLPQHLGWLVLVLFRV